MPLTQEQLKSALYYRADTGIFTWAKSGKGIRPGKPVGWVDPEGYLRITVCGQWYYAHRLAWFYETGKWPSDTIDHANRIRTDNRFSNLREATVSGNIRNRLLAKRDLPVGVYRSGPRFRVRIWLEGANQDLGTYEDLDLAELVSVEARDTHHGQFSVFRSLPCQ